MERLSLSVVATQRGLADSEPRTARGKCGSNDALRKDEELTQQQDATVGIRSMLSSLTVLSGECGERAQTHARQLPTVKLPSSPHLSSR